MAESNNQGGVPPVAPGSDSSTASSVGRPPPPSMPSKEASQLGSIVEGLEELLNNQKLRSEAFADELKAIAQERKKAQETLDNFKKDALKGASANDEASISDYLKTAEEEFSNTLKTLAEKEKNLMGSTEPIVSMLTAAMERISQVSENIDPLVFKDTMDKMRSSADSFKSGSGNFKEASKLIHLSSSLENKSLEKRFKDQTAAWRTSQSNAAAEKKAQDALIDAEKRRIQAITDAENKAIEDEKNRKNAALVKYNERINKGLNDAFAREQALLDYQAELGKINAQKELDVQKATLKAANDLAIFQRDSAKKLEAIKQQNLIKEQEELSAIAEQIRSSTQKTMDKVALTAISKFEVAANKINQVADLQFETAKLEHDQEVRLLMQKMKNEREIFEFKKMYEQENADIVAENAKEAARLEALDKQRKLEKAEEAEKAHQDKLRRMKETAATKNEIAEKTAREKKEKAEKEVLEKEKSQKEKLIELGKIQLRQGKEAGTLGTGVVKTQMMDKSSINLFKGLEKGLGDVIQLAGKTQEEQLEELRKAVTDDNAQEKFSDKIVNALEAEGTKAQEEYEKLQEADFKKMTDLEKLTYNDRLKRAKEQNDKIKEQLAKIANFAKSGPDGEKERTAYLYSLSKEMIRMGNDSRAQYQKQMEKEMEKDDKGLSMIPPDLYEKLEGMQRTFDKYSSFARSSDGKFSVMRVLLIGVAFSLGAFVAFMVVRIKQVLTVLSFIPKMGGIVASIGKFLGTVGTKIASFSGTLAGIAKFFGGGGLTNILVNSFLKGFNSFAKVLAKFPIIGWIITAVMAIIDIVRVFRALKGGTDGFFTKLMKGIVVALIQFLTLGLLDFKKVLGWVNKLFDTVGKWWNGFVGWIKSIFSPNPGMIVRFIKGLFMLIPKMLWEVLTFVPRMIFKVVKDAVMWALDKITGLLANIPIIGKFFKKKDGEGSETAKTEEKKEEEPKRGLMARIAIAIGKFLKFIYIDLPIMIAKGVFKIFKFFYYDLPMMILSKVGEAIKWIFGKILDGMAKIPIIGRFFKGGSSDSGGGAKPAVSSQDEAKASQTYERVKKLYDSGEVSNMKMSDKFKLMSELGEAEGKTSNPDLKKNIKSLSSNVRSTVGLFGGIFGKSKKASENPVAQTAGELADAQSKKAAADAASAAKPIVSNNSIVQQRSTNTTQVTSTPSRFNAEPTLRGTQMGALPGLV